MDIIYPNCGPEASVPALVFLIMPRCVIFVYFCFVTLSATLSLTPVIFTKVLTVGACIQLFIRTN